MKRIAKVLCLVLVSALLLAGCNTGIIGDAMDAAKDTVTPKTFTNAGISMTLTTKFIDFTETETNDGEYEFLYASDVHGVLALREDKVSLVDSFGEMDAKAYGDLIAELYEIDAKTEEKDGFFTYTYESAGEEEGKTLTFMCLFLETEQDFWNIQISCPTEQFAADQAQIWSWLTSAKVAEG